MPPGMKIPQHIKTASERRSVMGVTLSLQSIGKLGAIQAVNSLSASTKSVNESSGSSSFGDVLSKAADKPDAGSSGINSKDPKSSAVKADNGNSEDRRQEDVRRTGDDRVKAPKTDSKSGKTAENLNGKVEEAAKTVMEEIEEELGVSEEDILAAMETLGLNLADLLKGENIGALTAELKGIDISGIVTDEALYESVQDILGVQREVTGDLLQELGMTADEFRNALENGNLSAEPQTETLEAADTVFSEVTPGNEEPEAPVENPQADRRAAEAETGDQVITTEEETAGTPAETVKSLENVRNTDGQPERTNDEVIITKSPEEEIPADKPVEHEGNQGSRNPGGSERGRDLFEGQNPFDPGIKETPADFMDNLTEATSEATSEFANSYERIQDIMNQVRDQIRIQISEETTTMEMQLNPESLGKVGLHIESKAGNVTAQFFAQDESVRAALETQVAELRKNLEEQGIKVESVEVTLASREFESNFLNDGGNRNGDTPDSEEAERSARLRRINLGAGNAEEIPEEGLTEEEELNRRIMTENGNSVDFMA